MAKCIKDKQGNITRVSDDVAATAVRAGNAEYCPKHGWKEQGR